MTLSLNAILFLAGALQGIILSAAIFLKSRFTNHSRKLLAAFIVILTSQILLKVISKDWIGDYFSYFGIIAYQIPFLFGPVFFLFTKSIVIQNWRFKTKDLIHFLPFVSIALLILLLFSGVADQVQYILPNTLFRELLFLALQLLSICYYGYRARSIAMGFEVLLLSSFSTPSKVRIQWLIQFINVALVVGLITSVVLFLMYHLYPAYQEIRYLLLCQGLLIYWITYKALVHPQLFDFGEMIVAGGVITKPKPVEAPSLTTFKKYAHNFLSEEDALRIKERIIDKMERERLFLNSALSIEDFSKAVGESKHNISRVINEQLNVNFYDFVNGYRVAMARQLLTEPKMNHYTIAAIAFECGFNSVSSFNIVFKKFEYLTPSAFKKLKQQRAHTA